ncbi:hypothetical protein ACETK8_07120 [Brevundimonas staleyi]|uniref:Uncharacterized protein n=1 Tax=Brevundimonas staleyi TaxID=74326 RepID=A0ABW0FUP9_9CAUL
MLRLSDDPFFTDPPFIGAGPMLDLDAVDDGLPPDRLSRDEGRAAAGPDWSWTHLPSDEEPDND